MSDVRTALLGWLRFAAELGFDALDAQVSEPPPNAAAPVSAAAATAAPRQARVEAPSSKDAALAEMRKSLGVAPKRAAGERPRPRRPEAGTSIPKLPSAVPSTAPPAGAAAGSKPVERMGEVPASFLAIPDDPEPQPAPADLDEVRATLGDCSRCRLHEKRTNIVFGVGNPEAELMFVGEGPGYDEDRQGEPFVGKAGKLLNDIIKAIGHEREDVYIANVVKCRPPGNRTPEPDEAAMCRGFVFRQLAVIRPKVVVALGRPAASALLDRDVSITRVRGQVFNLFGARLVPTFHPAYLLRNPEHKRAVWEDMKLVRDMLAGKRAADGSPL